MKSATVNLAPISFLVFVCAFVHGASANAQSWSGDWAHWTKKGASFQGAGLRVKSCKDNVCDFSFTSEDFSGKTCKADGQLKLSSDSAPDKPTDERPTVVLKSKAPADCELSFQRKTGTPASVHAEFTGVGCKQLCTSPKALVLPDELVQISETPSLDPLPFPQCEAESSPAVKALCYDPELAKTYLKSTQLEDRARILQQTFYVAKDMQIPEPSFFWEACTGEDAKECVAKGVKNFADETNHAASRIQKLKNQLDADLKAAAPSSKKKSETAASTSLISSLKGTYKKKIKSGTMSGDKFEVTNDVKIENDDGDLGFDVLLNFFDEQECSLSGSAQPLKNGRFLYREGGTSCRLLIFKEGDELVLTDEPPNSCRKHCGKGASFYNARFPLSARSGN